jgi:hypothetical protein
MSTRSSWPGNVVFGEEATKALIDKIPGGWIGYETEPSPPTVDTTEDDLVSVTVTVPASRLIKISVTASIIDGDSDADGGVIVVYEGVTDLGRVHRHPNSSDGSFCAGFVLVNDASPGSHTYTVSASTSSGEFTFFGSVDVLVEDIGPSY